MIGDREHLQRKIKFVQIYHLYLIKRDRKSNHAKYKTFCSEDTKDTVKIPRNVLKAGAHGLIMCSALKFAIRCKTLPSNTKKKRASTREYFGQAGNLSENNESVDLRPALEMETFVKHYFRAPGNNAQ